MGIGLRAVKRLAQAATERRLGRPAAEPVAPRVSPAPKDWSPPKHPTGSFERRRHQTLMAELAQGLDPKQTWAEPAANRVVFAQPKGMSPAEHVRDVLEHRGPRQAAYFEALHGFRGRGMLRELRLREFGSVTFEALGKTWSAKHGGQLHGLRLHSTPVLDAPTWASVQAFARDTGLVVKFDAPKAAGTVFVEPTGKVSLEPRYVWDAPALAGAKALAHRLGTRVELRAPGRRFEDYVANPFAAEWLRIYAQPTHRGPTVLRTDMHPSNVARAARMLPNSVGMQLPYGVLQRHGAQWFLHRGAQHAGLEQEAAELGRVIGATVRVVD